jgi:hypothetical protein
MNSTTNRETGEVEMQTDWWWNWYMRGGMAVAFGSSGGLGADVGVVWYGSDEFEDGAGVCSYAALRYSLGGYSSSYR